MIEVRSFAKRRDDSTSEIPDASSSGVSVFLEKTESRARSLFGKQELCFMTFSQYSLKGRL